MLKPETTSRDSILGQGIIGLANEIKNSKIHKTDPDNPYRNAQNNLYAKELFYEFNTKEGVALYTLKHHDYNGCRSLYRLYMEMSDVSEYSFANAYFEGWRHWESIANSGWFSPFVEQWRSELEVKVRAEAIATAIRISKAGGKDALTAAKYVAEKGWEKTVVKRGRPNKEIDKNLEEAIRAHEDQQIEDDYKRINVN